MIKSKNNKKMFEDFYFSQFDLINNVLICAYIDVGFGNYSQDLKLGEWSCMPGYGTELFYCLLPVSAPNSVLMNSLADLNRLLNAYFITDFQAKELICFKIITKSTDPFIRKFCFIFGTLNFEFDNNLQIIDPRPKFSRSSNSFLRVKNTFVNNSVEYPWDELKNNYNKLTNPNSVVKLSLIRESFLNLNSVFSINKYFNTIDLFNGVTLLIATLENLLLGNDTDHQNSSLKFRYTAAFLYHKNVTKDFLDNYFLNHNNLQPLSKDEVIKMFKDLYSIRSDFAHGSFNNLSENKLNRKKYIAIWKRNSVLFKTSWTNTDDLFIRIREYSIIFSFMQLHIVALLKTSLDDFGKRFDQLEDEIKAEKK